MTDLYIEHLVNSFPAIREIWLMGSRGNGSARSDSDWDYLVFADSETLTSLTSNQSFHQADIDLLVVYDEDNFIKPWRDEDKIKHGTLSGWKWKCHSSDKATYRATKLRDGDIFDVNSFYEERAICIYRRG